MNQVHIHLLLNHAPIMGNAFGAMLLFYGLFKKSKSVIEASMLAFIITALVTIPVFLTGEPAEEAIENIPGIVTSDVERHEENAEAAFWLMEALGIFSAITFVMKNRENKRADLFTKVALMFSLVVFGFMATVGNDGGKIRHPEISSAAASATQAGEQGAEDSGKEVDD